MVPWPTQSTNDTRAPCCSHKCISCPCFCNLGIATCDGHLGPAYVMVTRAIVTTIHHRMPVPCAGVHKRRESVPPPCAVVHKGSKQSVHPMLMCKGRGPYPSAF